MYCCCTAATAAAVLLLPGWPHAVVTLEDSLAVGGNFLSRHHLPTHLAVYDMELRLRVQPSCQYPGFKQLMWHTANALVQRLQEQQQQQQQPVLSAGEYAGVPKLLAALQQWHQQGGAAAVLPNDNIHPPGDVMYLLSRALQSSQAQCLLRCAVLTY